MTAATALKIEHQPSAFGTLIRLTGTVDELFDTAKFAEGVSGVVAIDLSGVTRVTSFGVRQWVAAISSLHAPYIGIVNCRPAVVAQLNMVRNFAGTAEILSIFLPYACPSCGLSFETLADLRRQHAHLSAFVVPAEKCSRCGADAEFDDLPEVYLAYIAAKPIPAPPTLFDDLLSGHTTLTPNAGIKFDKLVEGRWTGLWGQGSLDGRNYFKRAADGLDGPLLLNVARVRAFTPEGVSRLLEFLAESQVPVVLDGLPIEIAAQLAAHSPASANTSLLGVAAPYDCPVHSRVTLTLGPKNLRDLGLQCPECGSSVSPAFATRLADAVAMARPAVMGSELGALLTARKRLEDRAPTMPGVVAVGIGSMIMQRYHLTRRLGVGGMAEVFLARQTSLGGFEKNVVVKHILPHLASDSTFVDMFLNEARIVAKINHPNVVQTFDVGREGANYYITMEYVAGADLSSLMKRSQAAGMKCSVSVACRIGAFIAWGLNSAHSNVDDQGRANPIVHRDVSPHNVLVSSTGVVKLTDFGIAKAMDTISNTPTTALKGKTAYVAPELVRLGSKAASSPAIDVYAAGLVIYQLLAGRNPFAGGTDLEIFSAIMNQSVPSLKVYRPDLPVELDAMVLSTLLKDPARRPTARTLAEGLESFLTAAGLVAGVGEIAAWYASIGGQAASPDTASPVLGRSLTPPDDDETR